MSVSRSQVGMSSNEIHERIKRFYHVGTEPSRPTVYRYIKALVEQKKMFEDDSGYRTHPDTKLSFKPAVQSHPQDELWLDMVRCLIILCDDPEDNGWRIKEIVDKRLVPLFNRVKLIMEVVETISRSPELAAHMAHNEKIIQQYHSQIGPEDLQEFWDKWETMGEYTLGPVKGENP